MKFTSLLVFIIATNFFTSCYTIEQGYYQIKLLMSEEPLTQALNENKDNPEKIAKLNLVKPVLKFTEDEIGLSPKNSYQKFIELKSPYVSWVVQAANKRSLSLKTWWFPLVGEQPYLGFFNKVTADKEFKKLAADNFDVSMGGVKAFSLLGYYPDPLYSSMLDGVSSVYFIETLIHETVHRTLYVKGDYAFNENLANFIARKATAEFIIMHPELGLSSVKYKDKYEKDRKAQQKFNEFIIQTKKALESFYADVRNDPVLLNEEDFMKLRNQKFNTISEAYIQFMAGDEKDTPYEFAFSKGKFNNAVFLSYTVYEEDQKPLEDIFIKSHSSLKYMVDRLKSCIYSYSESNKKIMNILANCFQLPEKKDSM